MSQPYTKYNKNGIVGRVLCEYPKYVICKDGRIYSLWKKGEYRQAYDGSYKSVNLSYRDENNKRASLTMRIHKLVAWAYHPNPNNFSDVDHVDGNKHNNHKNNLEWVTRSENIKRSHANKNRKDRGISVLQYNKNDVFLGRYKSARQAKRETGCNNTDILRVCRGQRKTCGGFKWKFEKEIVKKEYVEKSDEKWKRVPDHPKYWISNYGGAYSDKTNKYLDGNPLKGYFQVHFDGKGYLIHNIMMKTFVDCPKNIKKPVVNHKDGNKTNNVLNNLEWVSSSYNTQHAHDTGLIHGNPCIQYCPITGREIARYINAAHAHRKTKANQKCITFCCRKIAKYKTAGNFVWRYENDPLTLGELGDIPKDKIVIQYSKEDRTEIGIYINATEAARQTGASRTAISCVCNKKSGYLSAKGFIWRFATDPL